MNVHIGTSGWSYGHWDGVLYPPATPPLARLEHYVRRFRTVELNASFYRWPSAVTLAGWRRLPDGFQLSVKAPRGLTYAKKLYAPEEWIQRIATGLHRTGRLGPAPGRPEPDHSVRADLAAFDAVEQVYAAIVGTKVGSSPRDDPQSSPGRASRH